METKREINLLFACTTLLKDSTLVEEFDKIHTKLSKLFPNYNDAIKNTYIVMDLEQRSNRETMDMEYGLNLLEKHGYRLVHGKVDTTSIIKFLKKYSEIGFDAYILAQCSNFIDIYDFPNQESDQPLMKKLEEIWTFYYGLNTNGYILNYYYPKREFHKKASNEAVLVDIENFTSTRVFQEPSVFYFLKEAFHDLFKKVETGIYQKRKIKYDEILDTLIEDYEIAEDVMKIILKKKLTYFDLVELINHEIFQNQLDRSQLISRKLMEEHNKNYPEQPLTMDEILQRQFS